MKLHNLILPSLCLGGAALLLAPARPSNAFTKIGGSLGETQRDVRVFDNFLDATADGNATPDSQFPGWLGLELALWKGIVEWGAVLHGTGAGDPLGGNLLGNGGANFDAFWAGNADGIGTTNNNIVSAEGATANCSGGVLAYCELPISDGWRIRFCDSWTWDDGPGLIGSRWDIQGVMSHEYGHALGLGHSGSGSATMAPSGSPGQTSIRSIEADDVAGIQCVYGVASGTKPQIVATVASGGNLTIHGSNFSASGAEVWFANNTVTTTGSDPIVRVVGVSSSNGGTRIDVAIPALASPGDVIVNNSGAGHSTVSNAFPTDLVGTFGDPPVTEPTISSVAPNVMEALDPGTAQTITISGSNLDLATAVLVDGVPVAVSRYTIVDPSTILLDMPQVATLGAHTVGVTDGVTPSNFPVTIVANALPTFEMGNGDPLNVVDRDNGLPLILSGPVGSTMRLYASSSNLPSNNAFFNLEIGNNFTDLVNAGAFVIPAAGWLQINVPTAALPNPGAGSFTFYGQIVRMALPTPLVDSNVQSIVLVQ
jgi:hypothetical protein